MRKVSEKDYWVWVTVDSVEYEVGADLAWEGEYNEDVHEYIITKEPEFCDYLVLDPETGDPTKVTVGMQQEALKHLRNVYWNETLG